MDAQDSSAERWWLATGQIDFTIDNPDWLVLARSRLLQGSSGNALLELLLAAFHIDRAVTFLDRFVRDELQIELGDYLPSEFLDKVLNSEW